MKIRKIEKGMNAAIGFLEHKALRNYVPKENNTIAPFTLKYLQNN